jgi:hypothetical protein
MKRNELFNDSGPKKTTFEIVAAVRDNMGNPVPGKFKSFATDSAYKLSQFYLRANPPRKNKAKKSELTQAVEAETILAEINQSTVAPAEKNEST